MSKFQSQVRLHLKKNSQLFLVDKSLYRLSFFSYFRKYYLTPGYSKKVSLFTFLQTTLKNDFFNFKSNQVFNLLDHVSRSGHFFVDYSVDGNTTSFLDTSLRLFLLRKFYLLINLVVKNLFRKCADLYMFNSVQYKLSNVLLLLSLFSEGRIHNLQLIYLLNNAYLSCVFNKPFKVKLIKTIDFVGCSNNVFNLTLKNKEELYNITTISKINNSWWGSYYSFLSNYKSYLLKFKVKNKYINSKFLSKREFQVFNNKVYTSLVEDLL